jgi:magnesium and cobalt transporter
MPDPSSSKSKPTLLERMSAMLLRAPDDRDQLLQLLRQSQERDLLDAEAMSMIEGVLQMTEVCARDIMVPRSQIEAIDVTWSAAEVVPFAIRTAHSRFPVVEDGRDNVVGILHAKDLLRLYAEKDVSIRDLLRPAHFVPETLRLNTLLRDFRLSRKHLAIVVDEYGGVAGLITIENVLEQIVGEIEDEFDQGDDSDNLVQIDAGAHGPRFRVNALTGVAQFNKALGTSFDDDVFDTVGGLVTEHLGRVPQHGERIEIDRLAIEVIRGDARSIHTLLIELLPDDQAPR